MFGFRWRLRFIDIDAGRPSIASNYLAFCASELLKCIERESSLAPRLVLYGDSILASNYFVATPLKVTSSRAF